MLKAATYILFLFSFSSTLFAAHIVGGEFYYRCLGNNEYEVILKIYKDCYASGPNVADFDQPAYIGIFDGSGTLVNTLSVYLENRTRIPPAPANPCFQAPAHVCVEEGLYRFTINLPANSGIYTIAYQRCCRNHTIVNIVDPPGTGATYSVRINTHIPFTCNSSPVFNLFPPIVICAGEPLVFDHSASDSNGDLIMYEFCTPHAGADQNNPQPLQPSSPPYAPITWVNPYSNNYQVASNPPLSINPHTGLITGTPSQVGQYVVGVCAKEYRNGIVIGEIRRDFQFNVTQCLSGVQARIPTLNVYDPAAAGTDGVYAYECSDYTITFRNQSLHGTYYHWDFGVPGINSDTSNAFEPTYTYPDTGIYYIRLIVNPGYPCSDTAVVMVRIYPQFNVDFTYTEQCEPLAMPFTDQSFSTYNDVNSWYWHFGDGRTSTQQHPTHTYNQPGIYNVQLIATTSKGCIDTITKRVTFHPKPKADFDNTPTCVNTPITFFDTSILPFGTITLWDWRVNGITVNNQSSFTTTYSTLQSMTVTLIVASDFGCKDTITKNITIYPLPTITYPSDTEACQHDTLLVSASGGIIYNWYSSTGDTILNIQYPQIVADTSKIITVVVSDMNRCQSSGSFLLTVYPLPAANAGPDDYVCLGNRYQLNGSGGIRLWWSPGHVLDDSTRGNATALITDTTTFILTTISEHGCTNTDTVVINVQSPIKAIVINDTSLCKGDTVQLFATGGVYYEWAPPFGLSNTSIADPKASPEATTLYTVRIANDCFDTTLPVSITVFALPEVNAGPDDTIYRGETIILSGYTSTTQYYWSPATALNDSTLLTPTAGPHQSIRYILTAIDENNCIAQDTVIITVEVKNLLLVPSAFSPNGDGRNDLFRILRHLNIARLLEFRVFNRWGQLLWETNDLNAGWDGTYKGAPQPAEVYQYYIKALNWDGQYVIEKGNVTLLR